VSARYVSEIRVPFLHVFRFTRREQRGKSSPLGGPGTCVKKANLAAWDSPRPETGGCSGGSFLCAKCMQTALYGVLLEGIGRHGLYGNAQLYSTMRHLSGRDQIGKTARNWTLVPCHISLPCGPGCRCAIPKPNPRTSSGAAQMSRTPRGTASSSTDDIGVY
jgi:hypothetical protein